MKPPDTQQIGQVSEALEWLDAHGDALFAYAVARTGDSHLAEDLVQETFLSAMKAQDGFRGESSLRTWLVSILRRKVIDNYRRRSREQLLAESSLQARLDETCSTHSTADARLNSEEFSAVFDQCMKKLSPATIRAFVLRVMDDLEPAEVCRTLGISAANLAVRLHRARFALKECLQRNWRDEL